MDQYENSILIVDDLEISRRILRLWLGNDYQLHEARTGVDALAMAKKIRPDIILLELTLPDIDGFAVLSQLKTMEETKDIPVVFMTKASDSITEERAFEMDAADYIYKPFSIPILKMRVRNLIKIVNTIRTIEELSNTDTLTGIANRRSFSTRLAAEWSRAIRERSPLSLIIADADSFKKYNDTYGHLQGDVALKTIARVMAGCIRREIDTIARWGGEEFAVLLPMTDMEGGLVVAEKMRKAVESEPIPLEDKHHTITVSLGVSCTTPTVESDIDEFITNADQGLYMAKKYGRNRVCGHWVYT